MQVIGFLFVCHGIGMIYKPAEYIVFGAVLIIAMERQ